MIYQHIELSRPEGFAWDNLLGVVEKNVFFFFFFFVGYNISRSLEDRQYLLKTISHVMMITYLTCR